MPTKDYADFELKIGNAVDGRYPLSIRSPSGDYETNFAVGVPFDIASFAGDAVNAVSRDITAKTRSRQGPDRVAAAKRLGESLFTTVLASEVYAIYRESIGRADEKGKGLRVRLRIEPPELNTYPWEFLFNPTSNAFVGLSNSTPITRYLQLLQPVKELTIERPLSILGMIASPSDLEALKVGEERARIERALDMRVKAGAIKLTWVEGQTWWDLQRALRPTEGPWHVFHFIGHGGFDEVSGEGVIALCAEDGSAHRVPATTIARALGDHSSMRLAVLNSCEGARASATDSFSSTGAGIMSAGLPAVVSMQFEISDEAALEFSRTFYDCLASEMPVDTSVTEARKAIDGRWSGTSIEWGTPVLHLRSRDARLFEMDDRKQTFGPDGPAPRAEAMPRFSAQMRTPVRAPQRHVAKEAVRGLDILRQKVRRAWIAGVLERDAQYATLVELGMEAIGGLVDNRLGMASAAGDDDVVAIPSAQTIRDVYREQAGSLLVVGDPGSGKTTALLTIARDLLDRADTEEVAIPVIFNLSSWVAKQPPLRTWLADELAAKYGIPMDVGRTWIGEDRLIPFLDGLDEVATAARAQCVEAINTFQDETSLAAMVVACRYKEYTDLPVRLTLNAAVRLRQLTLEQVDAVVAAGGESLEALAQVLRRDSGFRIEARSPLMMRMMIEAYRGVRLEDLAHESAESMDARRNRIVGAYVERKLRLRRRTRS